MAQKGAQLDRETFSCSICLDLLKDPVTLACGHSYCMDCIKIHWDEEDEKGIYSCPQCRQTFDPRPVLVKSTMLAVVVEELKKTGLQAAPAEHCYAGPEDVACDFCTGRKLKAFKTCVVCMVSYCDNHLQPHYNVAPLKQHKLVEPLKKLQENLCSCHDEVMKIVSTAAERTEREKELEEGRQKIQQRIQDREKEVKMFQKEVEAINSSADKAVEDSEKTFTELIDLIQKRSSDVKQQFRSQQETIVSRVKDLQKKLEQEITELKRKDAELKTLSLTQDHNQFLQNYRSLPLPPVSESTHSSSIDLSPLSLFDDVTSAVSEVRDKLQDILRGTWTNILRTGTEVDVLLSQPDPTTRAEFLKYSRKITLDPNTANTELVLSEANRKATSIEKQPYPSHPDRFKCRQVLSKESLTGRCYWEVEYCKRKEHIYVAVAYKSITRDGCGFGYVDQSWALECQTKGYKFVFRHNYSSVLSPVYDKVGVYLDHSAGILSFYRVSPSMTMTLIHRHHTRFTQPLYAGLGFDFWYGQTAEFNQIK